MNRPPSPDNCPRKGKRNTIARIINCPYWADLANDTAWRLGRSEYRIWYTSSGYSGTRLKIDRQILVQANTATNCSTRGVYALLSKVRGMKRSNTAKSNPTTRLVKMPARLTKRVPPFGPPRSFQGSTLTAFPPPKPPFAAVVITNN